MFRELEKSIYNTKNVINNVENEISRFNIGDIAVIERGRFLISEWISKIPFMFEDKKFYPIKESTFYKWLNEDLKKIVNKNPQLLVLYKNITDTVNQIEITVKEFVEGDKNDESLKVTKELINRFMQDLTELEKNLQGGKNV